MNRYWPLLKPYVWIVIACTLLASIGGVIIAKVQPPTYVATSTVLISARAPGTNLSEQSVTDPTNSIQAAATYAAEIVSRSTMSFVAKQYPQLAKLGYSVDDLMADVSATASTSAATVTLTATAKRPGEAVQLATDVANAFVLQVQQQAEAQLDAVRSTLQTQLATYERQRAAVETELLHLPASATNTANSVVTSTGTFTTSTSSSDPRFAVYSSDLEALTQTIVGLQQQLAQLPPSIAGDATTIQQPTINDVTASKKTLLVAAATVAVGLVIGILIMLLMIFVDDRLRRSEQVKESLGLAYLGRVATAQELSHAPTRLRGEAIRDLSSVFVNMRLNHVVPSQTAPSAGTTLLISSAQTAEGKTTLAAALAATVARSGASVVIVDGNLGQPATHLALDMTPVGAGLTGLLRSDGTVGDTLQATNVPGLRFLPAGDASEYSALLLERNLPDIISQLRKTADVVIIDGPALLGGTDAMLMANVVDGVALVADVRHTRLSALMRARDMLTSVSPTPTGVIMNRLPVRTSTRFLTTLRAVPPETESAQPVVATQLSK